MPRASFNVQRALVVSGPLARPRLPHIGRCQRRPYWSGWPEFGQVQTGRGEQRTPIRRRRLTGRIFFFRRERLKVSEPALWIELHIDHPRHGRFGIVLLYAARNEHLIVQAKGQHGIGALAIPELERRRTAASDLVPPRERLVRLFHSLQEIVVEIE